MASHPSRSHEYRDPDRPDHIAPPRPKRATVLIIGPTQNGKSTFINKLRSLALDETPAVAVGDGVHSETKMCTHRDLILPLTNWKLIDRMTGNDVPIPKDEHKLFSTIWRGTTSSKCRIAPVDPTGPVVQLKVIDTPGLDDSDGDDNKNIEEVLRYLNEMSKIPDSYISSIIFITVHGAPFSNSFQKIYRYYEQCMPNLFGSLAIVSTRFSVMNWSQKYKKYGTPGIPRPESESAKAQMMQERRTDFAKTFNRDPMHFFIDNKPNEERLLEELLTRNTISDIINFVASQSPMEIEQMMLVKFDHNVAIDAKLSTILSTARTIWAEEEDRLLATATESTEEMSKCDKGIQICEDEIETWKKELRLRNNETRFALNSYSTQDFLSAPKLGWKWITRSKIKNSLSIREPKYAEFFVEAADRTSTRSRWTLNSFNADRTEWTGYYEADPGVVPNLTAQSYTTNRLYYAKQIEMLNASIRTAKGRIEDLQQRRSKANRAKEPDNPNSVRIRELGSYLAKSVAVSKDLAERKVPLETGYGPAARERYKKELDEITYEDLVVMLDEQYPELADAVDIMFSPKGKRK